MSHTVREKTKLLNRVSRLRGQIEAIERALEREVECAEILQLIASAREGSLEEVKPGDEDRVFYIKKWWQKLLIMFAGPAMNLLIAFIVLFFLTLTADKPTYLTVDSVEHGTPAAKVVASVRLQRAIDAF